jgi:hypothetical protein
MVTRMKVGADVVALHCPTKNGLTRDHELRRNTPAEEPHRDARLANALASQNGQLLSQLCLSAGQFNHSLNSDPKGVVVEFRRKIDGVCGHMPQAFNTASVIDVNTRSVFAPGHTAGMARNGQTSDFWHRLALARTTCTPPKSMRQEDIAKDYEAAYQSTVTKWKTGKSTPEPDTLKKMALDTNVNINWLWAGQGDMRPLPATDPIVLRLVEIVQALPDDASRLGVLEAALLRQATMNNPTVAATLREAQDAARKASVPARKRTSKT